MIKVIYGRKGTGKTKMIIDMANKATAESKGLVVVIEKGNKLRFDINHKTRLMDSQEYGINSVEKFMGFVGGIAATNYDVTDIFIDSIYKVTGCDDPCKIDEVLKYIEQLKTGNDINFVMTISDDASNLSDYVKSFE